MSQYAHFGHQLDSIVAFLGILRFFDQVKDAKQVGTGNELLRELHGCLVQARGVLRIGGAYDVKLFADQVVLGVPIDPSMRHSEAIAVADALEVAGAYQFILAIHGFFTAGGLTRDLHFSDELQAYGRGLVETAGVWYNAKVPRLVLHERAASWIRQYVMTTEAVFWASLETWLLADENDVWFVNYLAQSDPERTGWPRTDYLQRHADHIRQLPRASTDEIQVFQWLASYHNWFCQQYPELSESLQVVDHDDPFGLTCDLIGQPMRVSEWLRNKGLFEG